MPLPKTIFENFSEKFPLLQKFYGLYHLVSDLAKNEENTLRKSSEITVLEILEMIVISTRQSKIDKFQTLKQIMRKLDTLKVFADMAKDVKQISESKYSELTLSLEGVSKMIGGWTKAINPANAATTPAK
ncbi:MAG: four helix bundle protein [Candidatus Parcubacteria bacterium]|nr:four helix bundle protein [Candidatus Parcubacteria bacterium]